MSQWPQLIFVSLDAVTIPAVTKYRLAIALDIANFAWPVVIGLSPNRTGYGIALLIALLARTIRGRIAVMPDDPRTKSQRRAHAILTIIGYLIWISGIVYADIRFNDRAIWALSSAFIPVLCVMCYVAVRVNLGLDRPWGTASAKASNQTMQLTATVPRPEKTFDD